MLIYLDDLRKEEWFSQLPDKFRNTGKNDYFGFAYEYDYENTKIIVKRSEIYSSINIYLYKDLQPEEYLGYFKQPYNTRDNLFYYFLKTYIGDKATDFILSHKAKDDEMLLNEKPTYKFGDVGVVDRITYQEALSKFILKPSLINPILTLSDLLDSYLQKKTNKSLYGATIKKFVRMIKFSAEGRVRGSSTDLFIIPDENGLVRYMIVGENSEIFKNSEDLKKAKEMLRLKYSAERIYAETKWYYNALDGKFRRNIDDIGFEVRGKLTPHLKSEIYYPENCPIKIDEIYNQCVLNPRSDNWSYYIKKGYNGKLGTAFYHPTLYKHYPQLFSLPFYFVHKLQGDDRNGEYSYRYNPNDNDIVICGYSKSLTSILLHEIQHAIQRIEGFSTGGNQFLASMINSIGGGDVREYMILSSKITEDFCINLSNLSEEEWNNKRKKLQEYTKSILLSGKLKSIYSKSYCEELLSSVSKSKEEAVKDCYSICIYSVALLRYVEDENDVKLNWEYSKLMSELGIKDEKSIFKISSTIYKSDKLNEEYRQKGFSKWDVKNILFQTYSNIFGELEARSVQNIAYLPTELREYLLPYTSESLDFKSFSVIINVDEESESDFKIEGAIEKTNENKYIIHLTPQLSCVPIIHEMGHLVYDIISDSGAESFVNDIYTEKYLTKFKNADEFFCDYFSSYIYRLNINEQLSNDLSRYSNFDVYSSLDIILDGIFNVSKQDESLLMVKYLDYLKKLSEL